MKKRGFTLVEIMIVVGIITLLAFIAFPSLLRSRITANESVAQSTLKAISTAFETYAAANSATYPVAETDLTGANPPYLNQAYQGQSLQGYTYTYPTLTATAYCIQAAPLSANSGTKTFSITTGGVLTEAACAQWIILLAEAVFYVKI